MDGRLTQQTGRGAHSREWFEEDWVRELVKHLAPAAQPRVGVTVETILGPYTMDLLIQLGALRVGFTRGSASRRVVVLVALACARARVLATGESALCISNQHSLDRGVLLAMPMPQPDIKPSST